MSQRILLEVIIILVLVMANGAFAMGEIALVSARKARLQQLARRGNTRAAAALRLAQSPDRFLGTVQIGITTIGIFAGAFGGATIAREIDDHLETIPALVPYSEAIGLAVVVIGITYLSLIVGELVPKRIALSHPERIATLLTPPMQLLSRLAAPLVYLLTLSTRGLLKILRIRESRDPAITEDELRALLTVGARAGAIEPEERELVDRAFRLDERRIKAIMTPRVELEWLDATKPLDVLREQVSSSSHDWFPVATERIDMIVGVVRGREVLSSRVSPSEGLQAIIRQPLFIPETSSAFSVLQRFRDTGNHVAIIVDEFGGIEGLVTPTDILEALVGELPEIGDPDEPMIVTRRDGSWSIDATTDLEEVKLIAGVERLEGEREVYQTIGGYVADHLGSEATIGGTFVAGDLRFEVLDTDGRRIDRILVERLGDDQRESN